MDKQTKIQNKGIVKTQSRNLHRMKQTLNISIYHLQSYKVLFKNQKKMPHPSFHMEKEGGAKVWESKLIKVLQTQICQKKTHLSFQIERMGGAIDYKLR